MIVKGKDTCLAVYVLGHSSAIVLNKDTIVKEVDLIIEELLKRSDDNSCSITETAIMRLIPKMNQRKFAIRGGLGFIGENGEEIYPSVGRFLGEWMNDIEHSIHDSNFYSGYDPDVTFFHTRGYCYISTMSNRSKLYSDDNFAIYFPEKKFYETLCHIEEDLRQFTYGPLYDRVKQISASYAKRFADAFIINSTEYKSYYKSCLYWRRENMNTERRYLFYKLDEVRKTLTEEEFKGLSAIYLQTKIESLILDAIVSEDKKTYYYMCYKKYEIPRQMLMIITTDDHLQLNNLDQLGIPEEFIKQYDIYSYTDVDIVNEILVWSYLEQRELLETQYENLLMTMDQHLSFLKDKPITWWFDKDVTEANC